MFPKKIIGKYLGPDKKGVQIGKVLFKPNIYVECFITEEMFLEILELCKQKLFCLFEFASVEQVSKEISTVSEKINTVSKEISTLSEKISTVSEEINTASQKIVEVENEISDIYKDLTSLSEEVGSIANIILETGSELEDKLDDAKYIDGDIIFYSSGEEKKRISIPLPIDPREIELSKNETHILWRIKPLGKEFIPWNELISLSELNCNCTELKTQVEDLLNRVQALEGAASL